MVYTVFEGLLAVLLPIQEKKQERNLLLKMNAFANLPIYAN